jgi:hypothetical protein
MRFCTLLMAVAFSTNAFGMSQKPKVTVRFHPEANPQDGSSFVMPVKLQYQRRDAHLARVPAFSERQITAIYPFPSASNDGTWGCTFVLDVQGRIRLETMSTEQLGTALVLFIGTKTGQHQVIDMLIDRPVTNGMITVPRGMTQTEVEVLKLQFPVLGEEKGKKGKKKPVPEKKDDVTNWSIDRKRDEPPPAQPGEAPPGTKPELPVDSASPKRKAPSPHQRELRQMDLPRVGD